MHINGNKQVTVFPIYRPEPKSESICFNDFSNLLELASIIRNEIVIFGNFHIHLDANEDPNSRKFTELLTTFNLV